MGSQYYHDTNYLTWNWSEEAQWDQKSQSVSLAGGISVDLPWLYHVSSVCKCIHSSVLSENSQSDCNHCLNYILMSQQYHYSCQDPLLMNTVIRHWWLKQKNPSNDIPILIDPYHLHICLPELQYRVTNSKVSNIERVFESLYSI